MRRCENARNDKNHVYGPADDVKCYGAQFMDVHPTHGAEKEMNHHCLQKTFIKTLETKGFISI